MRNELFVTRRDTTMQIEQLGYFIEVVKKGSINLACEDLHISQQALSQSMRNLEKEIGFELLIRTHKGISLTEKGQEVFQAAIEICDRWQLLCAKLNEELLSGTLRVSVPPHLEELYYVLFSNYAEKHGLKIDLEIMRILPDNIAQMLEQEEFDLGLISLLESNVSEFMQEHGLLEFIPKRSFNAVILVSKYSSIAKKAVLTVDDLKNRRCFIENSNELETENFQQFAKLVHSKIDVVEVSSLYTKQKLVADNKGFALGVETSPILNVFMEKVIAIPLQHSKPVIAGVIYKRQRKKEKLVSEILKAL